MSCISDKDIKIFAEKCITEISFRPRTIPCYSYKSLPLCIIDCVYSLTVRYTVAQKVVDAYRFFLYMQNISEQDDTLQGFLEYARWYGGDTFNVSAFRSNRNQLTGRHKLDVCLDIADKLYRLLDINSLEDFRNYPKKELSEIVLYSVKGLGTAGVNYLFMLTGDVNRCKFDSRLQEITQKILEKDINNDECQYLFRETVKILQKKHSWLTVRMLDYCLWENSDKFKNKVFEKGKGKTIKDFIPDCE